MITTVLLSLPRSNSPIRNEERLAIKLRSPRLRHAARGSQGQVQKTSWAGPGRKRDSRCVTAPLQSPTLVTVAAAACHGSTSAWLPFTCVGVRDLLQICDELRN